MFIELDVLSKVHEALCTTSKCPLDQFTKAWESKWLHLKKIKIRNILIKNEEFQKKVKIKMETYQI